MLAKLRRQCGTVLSLHELDEEASVARVGAQDDLESRIDTLLEALISMKRVGRGAWP